MMAIGIEKQISLEKLALGGLSLEKHALVQPAELRAIADGGGHPRDTSDLQFTLDHYLLETGLAGIGDLGYRTQIFPDQKILGWAINAICTQRNFLAHRRRDITSSDISGYSWHELGARLTEKAIATLTLKLIDRLEA